MTTPRRWETSSSEEVFLSLGSNQGPSRQILEGAREHLFALLASPRASRIYLTEQLHLLNQHPFLNQVVAGLTALEPLELLDRIQSIESDFGRRRESATRYGPRTLDVDILLVGTRSLRDHRLTLRHPAADRARA